MRAAGKDAHAARGPKARSKARLFGPTQERHDPNPDRARAGPKPVAGRAWAEASARRAARPGPFYKGRPGGGPATGGAI
jgi:hypothetical protein